MKSAVAVDQTLFVKKPLARAQRVTLFEREIRERLSTAAIEILLERARVLSEGQRAQAATAQRAYFGSTMLTIDLASLGDLVRDPLDPRTAQRVAEQIRSDARITRRVQKIAARAAERLADGPVRARAAEVRVRAQATQIFLDIDVEG
jgi:hypothetical protein